MKFEWNKTPQVLRCQVHQEAFILDIGDWYGLSACNKSTRATPFRSGYPVNNIAPSTLPQTEQIDLTKKFQQIIGDLNWLSISTCLDITAIVSLLSANSHEPSPSHFDAVLHIVKYLALTPTLGLYYSSTNDESFHASVHFPTQQSSTLQTYCNANWGLMDASFPKSTAPPKEQSISSLRSLSG